MAVEEGDLPQQGGYDRYLHTPLHLPGIQMCVLEGRVLSVIDTSHSAAHLPIQRL